MCGKNRICLWLNVLLELVLIHYYFAYVVSYNCRSMFVYVGNMLFYLMYQSFKTVSGYVLIKNIGIVYCVWPTIFNTLFWKYILCSIFILV